MELIIQIALGIVIGYILIINISNIIFLIIFLFLILFLLIFLGLIGYFIFTIPVTIILFCIFMVILGFGIHRFDKINNDEFFIKKDLDKRKKLGYEKNEIEN